MQHMDHGHNIYCLWVTDEYCIFKVCITMQVILHKYSYIMKTESFDTNIL